VDAGSFGEATNGYGDIEMDLRTNWTQTMSKYVVKCPCGWEVKTHMPNFVAEKHAEVCSASRNTIKIIAL